MTHPTHTPRRTVRIPDDVWRIGDVLALMTGSGEVEAA